MPNGAITRQQYDLEERTALFGEAVLDFAKELPRTDVTRSLISQLVRSATSVGSNYCEADVAESKKDFVHKIGICKKEAKESRHWLRMIAHAVPHVRAQARSLWQEAHELQLIFVAIVRTSRESESS